MSESDSQNPSSNQPRESQPIDSNQERIPGLPQTRAEMEAEMDLVHGKGWAAANKAWLDEEWEYAKNF